MDIKVSIIQTHLYWENIPKNLDNFTKKISEIREETDLIILPEMFTTGFTMNASSVAEEMNGPTMEWMKSIAAEKKASICGSIIINDGDKFYNRLIWMFPEGNYVYYDKRHLFSMAGEDKVFTAGDKKILIDYRGFRFCPLICYDLRFPVWSRNIENYDALIYIANWPEKRNFAWKTLLNARAIENQCYAIGVNRVGEDGNNFYYSGDSGIIDPMGETMIKITHSESAKTILLSKQKLEEIRNKLPFLADKDCFEIN